MNPQEADDSFLFPSIHIQPRPDRPFQISQSQPIVPNQSKKGKPGLKQGSFRVQQFQKGAHTGQIFRLAGIKSFLRQGQKALFVDMQLVIQTLQACPESMKPPLLSSGPVPTGPFALRWAGGY